MRRLEELEMNERGREMVVVGLLLILDSPRVKQSICLALMNWSVRFHKKKSKVQRSPLLEV